MRPAFVFSLVAALGIHAVILVVPLAAPMEERNVPTVELELTDVTGLSAPVARPAAVLTRPIGTQTPSSTTLSSQAESQSPASAAEPQDVEPHPAAPGGQAEVPAGDQAASVPSQPASPLPSSAAGGVATDGGAPLSRPAGAGAQASASGPPGPALGTPAASAPVFVPPKPRTEILPTYPRSARRLGLEGVAKVAAFVDDSGKVTSAEVFSSSGHGVLDQAAVEAVRRTVFDPALEDGRPIPCRLVIPVRFRLAAKPN